jgi:dTDP-4-amino-4,6-dideoxygalactose transaminase
MMKKVLNDLAAFGGPPCFPEPLHVGRPNIGDETDLLDRVRDILNRRCLTNDGPYVEEFERRIADHCGVRHCVATCNGTIALVIATRALDMKGEVILPSFTFVATAHALQWCGITPVFCDIDRTTHTLDPSCVEKLVTSRTSGIIGVHLWGRSCEIAALEEIARRHGLALLFDAAHAFGCSHRGRMIGSFGNAEVLSFHATKFVNSFEGGAIVTNDDALADKARLMRNFGFSDVDQVVCSGINGKMTEVAAAMGLTSLESVPMFLAENKNNHAQYETLLTGLPGVSLMRYAANEHANYQYVVLEIDPKAAGVSRDVLLNAMTAENVLARRYFYPGCHRHEPYRSLFPSVGSRLPETQRLADRILQLPTGTAMNASLIEQVCELFKFIVVHGPAASGRLQNDRTHRCRA